MLLDERCTRRKYRRERQEQTADDRSEAIGNVAGNDGRRPTERKPDQILVPASFASSGKVELNNHWISKRIEAIPNATANQTISASIVAVRDESVKRAWSPLGGKATQQR